MEFYDDFMSATPPLQLAPAEDYTQQPRVLLFSQKPRTAWKPLGAEACCLAHIRLVLYMVYVIVHRFKSSINLCLSSTPLIGILHLKPKLFKNYFRFALVAY